MLVQVMEVAVVVQAGVREHSEVLVVPVVVHLVFF